MTNIICERAIISGHEIEHYQYLDKPLWRGYKRLKPRKEKEKKEQTEKSKFSVNRTITEIRRILSNNPQLIKFLTLTTKIIDVAKANHLFNLYTQRMKDRYPEFQYFAVIEFMPDIDHKGNKKPDGGEVHYHALCNLRYVRNKELAEIWGQGFVRINRKKKADDLRGYLSKYLWKDMKDKRLFGKKKYFCSQDLNRSTEYINDEAKSYIQNNESNFELIEDKVFSNEYRGDTLYFRFHDKNYLP
ncbi:MAG: hypothetical protein PHF35_04875 [Candidatus Moranbacteria bacterium]|nr:hypothetical protein [Candidatus Moranbacteria bacterium]